MKNYLITTFIVLLFVACKSDKQRYFSTSNEIDVLKSGIIAYETGDWTKWRSHFADTAKIYPNTKNPINIDVRLKELQDMATLFSNYGFGILFYKYSFE